MDTKEEQTAKANR